MSTPLILSADDYAQSDAIDAGILSLIQQKRLTATSCLTLSPRWPLAARRITAEIRHQADIGLHLDFTQYSRIIRHPHPQLIVRTLLRSVDRVKIRSSIRQQLDLFEQAIGTAPDYVDGHQHVHQLPQIRDILLNELASRYSNTLPWIRVANPPSADGFKGWVIGALGSRALKLAARKQDFHTSDVLLGVYGFNDTSAGYVSKVRQWLENAVTANEKGNVCAFMSHPGIETSAEDNDPIWQARPLEYEVLSSDIWPELMQELSIAPIKGSQLFQTSR